MKTYCVIVEFNNRAEVERLQKTLAGVDVIVVDNSKNNRGFAKAVNIGIKRALKEGAGQVLLVNPDIKISQKILTDLLRINTDIGAPVLKFRRNGRWVFDLGGKVNWIIGRTDHYEVAASSSAPRNASQIDYVSGACMMIKKEVFEKIGFFDEQFFMYFEDVDFCLMAKQAGFRIAVDQKVIVEHQIEEHRNTHDSFKMQCNLASNLVFINKWVPWFFRPAAWIYFAARFIRER